MLRGEVPLDSSASQLARGLGISPTIVSLAGKLQGHPALEAEVAAGRLSVTAALKMIPAATKAPAPPMPRAKPKPLPLQLPAVWLNAAVTAEAAARV
jgi:hypothetical protein